MNVLAISHPILIRFECSWALFKAGRYRNAYPYPSLPVVLTRAGLKTRGIHYSLACPRATGQNYSSLHNTFIHSFSLNFITYTLHQTKLHPSVMFASLILFQRLRLKDVSIGLWLI